MKKLILIFLVLILLIFIFLNRNFSANINDVISNNILNPYDPLKVLNPDKLNAIEHNGWKDSRNSFPIFAYTIPHNSKNITESLRIIEDGGINIVINGSLGWIEDAKKVKKGFEQLGDSNLKWIVIVGNECKDDFIFNNVNDDVNNNLKKYLKLFNESYVYGWYIWDEPGTNRKPCSPFEIIPNDDNADINRMTKQIYSDTLFDDKLAFVNLFPTYWDLTPTLQEYEKYIDAFISSQEYRPKVLCFDHYPLLKSEAGGFRKDYYSNLSIILRKSIEYKIPFWIIVLSSGHGHYKNPVFEEISLQVYSAMAYGAKGIGYYLYSKSWEHLGYSSWILEDYVDNSNVPDSLHGPLYFPIKNLNSEVQTIGQILLNLEPIQVIHSSDYPNKQKNISETILKIGKPNKFIKNINNTDLSNSETDILIGIMQSKEDYKDKGIYLLVVNKNVTINAKANITLNSNFKISMINKNEGEMKFIERNDNIVVDISPGGGELFYCE